MGNEEKSLMEHNMLVSKQKDMRRLIEHYDEHSIATPVVDDMTIHAILVLTVMAGWSPQLVDVKGAFPCGEFKEKHKMYMNVPQGFEKWYGRGVVLLLIKSIYSTEQAASRFWELL